MRFAVGQSSFTYRSQAMGGRPLPATRPPCPESQSFVRRIRFGNDTKFDNGDAAANQLFCRPNNISWRSMVRDDKTETINSSL